MNYSDRVVVIYDTLAKLLKFLSKSNEQLLGKFPTTHLLPNFTKLIAIFEPVLRSSVTVELPHNRISHKPHDLQNNVGQSP